MASFFSSPSSRNKLKSLTTDRDDDKFIQRVDGGVQLNIPVPGPFGSGTIPINLTKQSAKDVTRQVAQGITLGTADEIESYVRSLAGKDKDEALEEIRTEIKRFEQNNPGVALSSEIVGSALTGGLGIGKTAVRTFLKSTGLGGVYGAGKAEPDKDATLTEAITKRAKEGVTTSAYTAPFAAVGSAFQASPIAKELIKKGVKLSPAQVSGGGAASAEEAVSVLPIIGKGPRKAREESLMSFSRASANEVLGNIKNAIGDTLNKIVNIKPLKNNITGNQGTKILNSKVDKAYTEVLKPLRITNGNTFKSQANAIIDNALPEQSAKLVKKKLQNIIYSKFKNVEGGTLKGKDLKEVHSNLRNEIVRTSKSPSAEISDRADALRQVDNLFKDAMKNSSKAEDYAKYVALDKVYPDILAYRNAAQKAQSGGSVEKKGELLSGVVTPQGLLQGGMSVARKRGQERAISEGRFPMSTTAQQGSEILRTSQLNPGLATFYTVGGLAAPTAAAYGTTGDASAGIYSTAALAGLYATPQGRRILAELLKRNAIPRSTPFLGAETRETFK